MTNESLTLRRLRKQAGLTQKELSRSLKVHNQFISNCERAICSLPIEYVRVFAKKTKCDVKLIIDAKVKDFQNKLWREVGKK